MGMDNKAGTDSVRPPINAKTFADLGGDQVIKATSFLGVDSPMAATAAMMSKGIDLGSKKLIETVTPNVAVVAAQSLPKPTVAPKSASSSAAMASTPPMTPGKGGPQGGMSM